MAIATALTLRDIEQLDNYRRRTAKGEYSAACPFCDSDDDAFRFWPERGNYWCRRCRAKGFVDGGAIEFDKAKLEAWQRAEARRKEQEQARTRRQLGTLADKVKWYHGNVRQAQGYWYSQGLTDATIERFVLGYAPSCPTYQASPSYVIPYYVGCELVSIRHRLASPNGSGKYRPEFAGLGNRLFNLDTLRPDDQEVPFGLLEPGEILLVEGEIKAMYLDDVQGLPTVGVPGASSWQDDWTAELAGVQRAYVALDPGAEEQAGRVCRSLVGAGIGAMLVTLPSKPDDFFVRFGGGIGEFMTMLGQGRVIR